MNIFQIAYHFNNYKQLTKELKYDIGEVLDAVKLLISFVLFITLFPVVPLIRAYFTKKHAIKEYKNEN